MIHPPWGAYRLHDGSGRMIAWSMSRIDAVIRCEIGGPVEVVVAGMVMRGPWSIIDPNGVMAAGGDAVSMWGPPA